MNQNRPSDYSKLLNSQDSSVQELNSLQTMMQGTQDASGGDPEMQQINGMLEKILDIQHPDRVKEKIKQSSEINKRRVYPVLLDDPALEVSVLQTGQTSGAQ